MLTIALRLMVHQVCYKVYFRKVFLQDQVEKLPFFFPDQQPTFIKVVLMFMVLCSPCGANTQFLYVLVSLLYKQRRAHLLTKSHIWSTAQKHH